MNEASNYNIFDMLSSFVNLETITIYSESVTTIPENAFKIVNGQQTKLTSIELCCRNSLTTIGNNAFSDLNNLKFLSLANQNISHINSHSFHFNNGSNGILYIQLF